MAIANKQNADFSEVMDGFEGHWTDFGQITAGFETYDADQDVAPLFAGLPDDACQCDHWGYVVAGKVGFRYTDGTEETIHGGEAYHARPGHTPVFYAGTQVVEFSPSGEFAKTVEVVTANIAKMEAQA